jgi:ParB family chromosome partitioning protein
MEVFDNSIVEQIELRMIRPSKFLIRYDDAKNSPEFINLKTSIKENGLLQPIVIRPLEHGFEIVAGHRRFSACKSLRWRFLPCKIREFSDKHAYEIQLTENIQRKSMEPFEEAEAYQKYVVDYGWGGMCDLAKKIGKSAEHVSHRMQLLKLPKNIQEQILNNNLSVSQALEITTTDSSVKNELVDEIVNNKLTVRQIRKMKNELSEKKDQVGYKKEGKSKELNIIRKSTLALKVTLSRIDDLIDDAHKIPPSKRVGLIEYLMDIRRKTHAMIDDSIQCKKRYHK